VGRSVSTVVETVPVLLRFRRGRCDDRRKLKILPPVQVAYWARIIAYRAELSL